MAVIVRDSIPVAEVGNERQKSKGESGGKNWWRENFWGGEKKKKKLLVFERKVIYTDRIDVSQKRILTAYLTNG